MKNEDIRKKKFTLGCIAILILTIFVYGIYVVMGRIRSSQELYLMKQKELLSLEQKQREVARLEQDLAGLKESRVGVEASLLLQRYDDKSQFIIEIENIAKGIGLGYALQIQREVTKEDIALEKEALARARRGQDTEKKVKGEEHFPEIDIAVKLVGDYAGVIKFLERFQSLPYYIEIQGLDISRGIAGEEGSQKGVEATLQAVVFTRE